MKHGDNHSKPQFDPETFSSLPDFFAGYLHEDFSEEYGSASEALESFLSDASGDEIQNVKEEWLRFRDLLKDRPFGETQAALHRLGAAWQPVNPEEIAALDEILARA